MKIFEANCFTSEMLSQTPKVLKSGAVQIGPNYLGVDGKAMSAFWNSDGALVISDDKGVTHYFVGLNKDFPAYGDEKRLMTLMATRKPSKRTKNYVVRIWTRKMLVKTVRKENPERAVAELAVS